MEGSEEGDEDVGELRIVVGLFDESIGVLEEVESVGEREKVRGIGGESEERLERSSILRRNGVGKAIQILCDPSVSFPHAQVRHCYLLLLASRHSSSTSKLQHSLPTVTEKCFHGRPVLGFSLTHLAHFRIGPRPQKLN